MHGLLRAVAASLGYLLDETDSSITQGVLFEVRLELSEPDIIFSPSLDSAMVDNFYDRMLGYIEDVFNVCRLIPRVLNHGIEFDESEDKDEKQNYYTAVTKHKELKSMKESLMSRYSMCCKLRPNLFFTAPGY